MSTTVEPMIISATAKGCSDPDAIARPTRSMRPPRSFNAANQGVSLPGRNSTNQPRTTKKSTVVAKKSSMKPHPNMKCMTVA